nr:hypothetical protein [Tanacetum cinerariifolium]
MGRDTIHLENAISTISQEYVLEFTSEYGIPKSLHSELPGPEDPIVEFPEGKVDDGCRLANDRKNTPLCYTKPLDSLKNWNDQLFWVDDRVFPTAVDWRTSAPKDQMPPVGSYSMADRYFLRDDVYLTFLYDDDRDMDLFNLISAHNPAKVKTRTRPCAAHEVPLLTATANRVIHMEDMTEVSGSLGTSFTIEKSPLDFSNEDPPLLISESIRAEEQGQDELSQGATPSTLGGKSLASMGIETGTTVFAPMTQEIPVHTEGVSDLDSLSYAKPRPAPEQDGAQSSRKAVVTEDPDSEKSTSFTSMVGSPGSIYQSGWGVTNNCHLDTLAACHDMETKLLKKAVAQVARRDQRIKAGEKHIRNLEALLEAKVDMKGAANTKNVELAKELESLHVQFLDLQVSNNQLSQQVSTLQAQIMGKERIKAAFEEFKKYEDDRVSSRCAEMDARLDALSIDFDEELYPHMLTTISGRRWIIGHGLRLAVMNCAESTELRQVFSNVVSVGIDMGMSEGLKHRVENGKAKVDLAAIEAYDPKANTKYVAALHALKDLKYPLVDQLEKLKDAPIDIPVYPEVRNPKDPWSFKDEILLEDVIAANVSRAEKKKKCRVVCHTHGVGSAHHARSDGVLISVLTISLQGLVILLADAITQTEIIEDEASPRLIRSKSLPPLYNLDWP